jgi:hypothetical protein
VSFGFAKCQPAPGILGLQAHPARQHAEQVMPSLFQTQRLTRLRSTCYPRPWNFNTSFSARGRVKCVSIPQTQPQINHVKSAPSIQGGGRHILPSIKPDMELTCLLSDAEGRSTEKANPLGSNRQKALQTRSQPCEPNQINIASFRCEHAKPIWVGSAGRYGLERHRF